MTPCIRFSSATLLLLALSIPSIAETHLALDFGLSVTKSNLGVCYMSGKDEFNVGLKGFAFSNAGEYYLAPGLSYNRYFTDYGWYGSVGYSPEYLVEDVVKPRVVSPGVTAYDVHREKGWNWGELYLGGGKNFQFTSWGVHLDGGLAIPLVDNSTKSLELFIGIGGSYRFKLD